GRSGEIRGHRKRSAAVVRERRNQHAPVTDGYELGNPGPCLLLQQLDRVAPLGRGLPNSVIRTRRVGARGLPAGSSHLRRLALRARGASAVLPSSVVAARFGPRCGGALGGGGGAFVTRVHVYY